MMEDLRTAKELLTEFLNEVKRFTTDCDLVVEYCSECDTEVEMRWDVERDGYLAYCPHCGCRLMLCDECQHPDGEYVDDCDYCSRTDSCRYNPM